MMLYCLRIDICVYDILKYRKQLKDMIYVGKHLNIITKILSKVKIELMRQNTGLGALWCCRYGRVQLFILLNVL